MFFHIYRFSRFRLFLCFLLCTFFIFSACTPNSFYSSSISDDDTNISNSVNIQSNLEESHGLKIYFFDVGQGDSALFISPDNNTMLIDAGDIETQYLLLEKLENLGIKQIDVLIATHPHSDHIGGMQTIIENFKVNTIYMPDIVHTSKIYLDLLDSISNKNIPVYEAKNNTRFQLGQIVECEFLAPCATYEDLNNSSVVTRIIYGDTSFLMTGDAEAACEADILANHNSPSLKSTLLKIGHHGSDSSTSEAFLDVVSPEYAVISCGIDNSYGHPHTEVLERLAARNILTFRTDKLGDIYLFSDGQNLSFSVPGEIPQTEAENMLYVYITDTGKTYHKEDCSFLSKSKHKISLQEAKNNGYIACKRCFNN